MLGKIIQRSVKNEVFLMSNAVAFKMILSFFPFIIFIIAAASSLNINYNSMLMPLIFALPPEIKSITVYFVDEVLKSKRFELIPLSLFISVFSASSGFNTILKVLNDFYDASETRNVFKLRIIAVLLVLLFSVFLILIFSIYIFFDYLTLFNGFKILKNILGFFILCVMTGIVYIVSVNKKISVKSIIPGTLFTVFIWIGATIIFNFYMDHFADYSAVYGAIGAFFVFFYWINLLSFVFLVGGNINACIYESKQEKRNKKCFTILR